LLTPNRRLDARFFAAYHALVTQIHFHCHAPTCLEMAIYRNETGELVCSQKPIYGGTGKISDPKFDEPGYILQVRCQRCV
jgi:hypothetical protein